MGVMERGQVVGERYRIVGALGRGGMGTTYEAEDVETGDRVALKALSMKALADWKSLELFEREARVLEQLDHPNIPRFIDTLSVEGEGAAFFIVQELVEGQSLAQRVEAGWRPDEAQVRGLARALLETLVYLHGLNPPVIHRDIKPQNVLMRPSGHPALVDFGSVKDAGRGEGSFASTVVGTYGYMAPEQLRGRATPSSDLYALGTTLVFLLTHQDPAALPHKRLKIDFREAAQVSPGFALWLDRILEPAPEDRIPTAREALAGLDDLDRAAPVTEAPPPSTWVRLEPPAGSLMKVRESGERLDIELPAQGMGGMTLQKAIHGGFSLFWMGFAIFWATLAVQAVAWLGLLGVVMLAVGLWSFLSFLNSLYGSQRLHLDAERFELESRLFGGRYSQQGGVSRDIGHIGEGQIHGIPKARETTRVEVGVHNVHIGHHITEAEHRWLRGRLEDHLAKLERSTLPPLEERSQGSEEAPQAREVEEVQAR